MYEYGLTSRGLHHGLQPFVQERSPSYDLCKMKLKLEQKATARVILTRDEPGGLHIIFFEQLQQTRNADFSCVHSLMNHTE